MKTESVVEFLESDVEYERIPNWSNGDKTRTSVSRGVDIPQNLREEAALESNSTTEFVGHLYSQAVEAENEEIMDVLFNIPAFANDDITQIEQAPPEIDFDEFDAAYKEAREGWNPSSNGYREWDPHKEIPRIVKELGMSNSVLVKSHEIINEALTEGLPTEKNPESYGAAAVYSAVLLENDKRTQSEFGEVQGISQVTTGNYIELMARCYDGLVKENKLDENGRYDPS